MIYVHQIFFNGILKIGENKKPAPVVLRCFHRNRADAGNSASRRSHGTKGKNQGPKCLLADTEEDVIQTPDAGAGVTVEVAPAVSLADEECVVRIFDEGDQGMVAAADLMIFGQDKQSLSRVRTAHPLCPKMSLQIRTINVAVAGATKLHPGNDPKSHRDDSFPCDRIIVVVDSGAHLSPRSTLLKESADEAWTAGEVKLVGEDAPGRSGETAGELPDGVGIGRQRILLLCRQAVNELVEPGAVH